MRVTLTKGDLRHAIIEVREDAMVAGADAGLSDAIDIIEKEFSRVDVKDWQRVKDPVGRIVEQIAELIDGQVG